MFLDIRNLSVFYMGPDRLALEGVNLSVDQGEIVALLGPNGAGKSTVLKAIFKDATIKGGQIFFQGTEISRELPHKLARLGIAFIPEGRKLFGSMTVDENLDMGGFILRNVRELKANREKVFQSFPVLADLRGKPVKKLSGGEQQMVAFGRALMINPKLILMDEPSLGLAPRMVDTVFEMVGTMKDLGITILLVEQNVRRALEAANRAYVLNLGRVAFGGTSKEISGNSELNRLYLGG